MFQAVSGKNNVFPILREPLDSTLFFEKCFKFSKKNRKCESLSDVSTKSKRRLRRPLGPLFSTF